MKLKNKNYTCSSNYFGPKWGGYYGNLVSDKQ